VVAQYMFANAQYMFANAGLNHMSTFALMYSWRLL